jgi:hypothetical protein
VSDARRRSIPPRRRFFLGCEGYSEQSYGALLQELADQSFYLHIYLDVQPLYGGDPLAVVEGACLRARQRARDRGLYAGRAVLLDADRLGQNPERDNRIERLATEHRLLLVWQRPCHEAFLLRHLVGCQTRRPGDPEASRAALLQQWPSYRKPMSARRLAERITLAEIRAATRVEPELRDLLSLLGFHPV